MVFLYTTILLCILIFTLSIVLIKLLNLSRNQITSILITGFIILFLCNLNTSIQASLTGLNLVIKSLFPTIFPFSVICNLLICYDGISLYSKLLGPLICKPLNLNKSSSFPITASVLSGYPLGCKYSCDLYAQGYINRSEFERLLNIATNASPIFLIGSVGVAMLGNIKYGIILLIGNYLSPLIIGILTKNKKNVCENLDYIPEEKDMNFGSAIKFSIENGINTTLQVGAFVIIFSIIIGIIKNSSLIEAIFTNIEKLINLPPSTLYGLFLGSIEFTNGCKLISLSNLSIVLKLSIISFICSFSGLSIIGQISSFIGDYNISLIKYSLIKFCQGLISFIVTFFASIIILREEPASTIILSSGKIYIVLQVVIYSLLIASLVIAIILKRKKLHIP